MRAIWSNASVTPTESGNVIVRIGDVNYWMDIHDARSLHKELGECLEVLARQRITNAQDTVDQIRSDNALRSDFV